MVRKIKLLDIFVKRHLLQLICILLLTCIASGVSSASERLTSPQQMHSIDVFVSGRDGYHTYRIPSLLTTKKGTLLAFCEGRKSGRSDSGDIDLLVKHSRDMGKTWSTQQVIWDDKKNTCGNPCPVVDQQTGTIWLLMTWNRGDDRAQTTMLYPPAVTTTGTPRRCPAS